MTAEVPSGPIAIAECCREWPIVFWWPVHRCGICGKKPKTLRFLEDGE